MRVPAGTRVEREASTAYALVGPVALGISHGFSGASHIIRSLAVLC